MKIYSYNKSIFGVIFATALLTGIAHAQTSSVTTGSELESTGTISEYTPGGALVLDIGTGELVQFKLSQNVVYADPDGTLLEAPGLSTKSDFAGKLLGWRGAASQLSVIGEQRRARSKEAS